LEEAARRDADLTLFIFLNDLKAHTELLADIGLRQTSQFARQAELPTDVNVDRIRTMLFRRVATTVRHSGCLPIF